MSFTITMCMLYTVRGFFVGGGGGEGERECRQTCGPHTFHLGYTRAGFSIVISTR